MWLKRPYLKRKKQNKTPHVIAVPPSLKPGDRDYFIKKKLFWPTVSLEGGLSHNLVVT